MKKLIEEYFHAPDLPAHWRRTLKAMKIATAIILVVSLHVSATGVAQTINFTGENVPLTKVFNAIEEQLGYGVLMPHNLLEASRPVTVKVNDGTLDELLQKCFAFQPSKLTYTLTGHTIYISQISSHEHSAPAQDPRKGIKVTGTVYNENGVPLSGANVVIEEIMKGTITNAKGEFVIPAAQLNQTILISYVGYENQKVKVTQGLGDLNIYLKIAKNDLDKAVVQAYGTTTERLATGNIGTVTAEEIAKHPQMNVLNVLQGQVAGAIVTNTSGYASGTVKVEIRGRNTINPAFPSDPLYIIDGVPLSIQDLQGSDSYANGAAGVIQTGIPSPAGGQSPFFSINPADIESVSVLKDADATAIYGSRGANGVILITTKRGRPGKSHADINVYSGISQVTRTYTLLNSQEYYAMRREALKNDGLPVDMYNAPDLTVWDTTRYTDWQKYLFGGLGRTSDVQVSLSGGDAQTTYRLAGGYHYMTEFLTKHGANIRGSVNFNINHKSLNQRFNLALSGFYTLATSDMIGAPGQITLPPDAPAIFDSKGNLNFAEWDAVNGSYPFANLLQPYHSNTNFLNANLTASYQVLSGFVFKTSLGYNYTEVTQSQLYPIASQDPALSPTGSNQFGYTFIKNIIVEPQLEYNTFIGKGKLDVLAGATDQRNPTSSVVLQADGITNDALINTVNSASSRNAGNFQADYRYAGIFARINYNWADKYIINLNGRRDGSSKFGPGRQYGDFGSAGFAWIFSEENFIKKNLTFLSFGKIRGSYGTTGGDQLANYAYLSRWSFGRNTYNNALPLNPLGHTDSLVHWQVNRKLELSATVGVLHDRVTLEADWYQDRCNDQLVAFPTPYFSGFPSVISNTPADVQNTGLEFTLKSKLVDQPKFRWSMKFNMGLNWNKLLAYPNLAQSPYVDAFIVGKPLNIAKVLHATGVDPQTGQYTFQDRNHDGQVTMDFSGKTPDDRYPIDLSPKYDGRLSQEFVYKNWDLAITFYFRKQMGANALASILPPGGMVNQPVSVLNRWQKPGDVANTALFTTIPGNSFFDQNQFSDAAYTDASFIRLQNLSLAYSVPSSVLKKLGVSNFRIYIEGDNLVLFTKYNGLDPETQNFGGPPRPRILATGLTCSF